MNIELLTMTEAARVLRVESSTIRGWRLRGQFPALFVKVGGRVLIPRVELERLIEQSRPFTAQSEHGSTTKGTR
jgi:excisionase family DNA binding protein